MSLESYTLGATEAKWAGGLVKPDFLTHSGSHQSKAWNTTKFFGVVVISEYKLKIENDIKMKENNKIEHNTNNEDNLKNRQSPKWRWPEN